jgi:hypothetical protein
LSPAPPKTNWGDLSRDYSFDQHLPGRRGKLIAAYAVKIQVCKKEYLVYPRKQLEQQEATGVTPSGGLADSDQLWSGMVFRKNPTAGTGWRKSKVAFNWKMVDFFCPGRNLFD